MLRWQSEGDSGFGGFCVRLPGEHRVAGVFGGVGFQVKHGVLRVPILHPL